MILAHRLYWEHEDGTTGISQSLTFLHPSVWKLFKINWKITNGKTFSVMQS